ncbi:MAG: fused MFS/spermidine synthase [Planctomycetota bacterium]
MAQYSIPIFIGAFLLFLIQPLMGKFILPWFGGTPAVWTTCMLFFQVLLLCGYGYAHLSVSYLKPRAQAALHVVLLLVSLVFLPVMPDVSWKPPGPEAAAWRILALLTATAGLPFLLLSATGPLLQAWYSRRRPGILPYRLYALSNVSSLLALLSYPFWIEPAFLLKTQAGAWAAGYGLFTLSCGWCAVQTWLGANTRNPSPCPLPQGEGEMPPSPYPLPKGERENWRQGAAIQEPMAVQALWVALAACGSVLLLSTTSQLSQHVAVVPFLWILPLSLYLLTFVLCFHSPRWYWRPLWLAALPAAVAGAFVAPFLSVRVPLALQVFVYCAILFAGCMICHGELARLRPGARRLTAYYLLLAAGGALGGMVCSLIAPAVFNGLWEYQCGIEALCVLAMLTLFRDLRLRAAYTAGLTLAVALALGLGFVLEARSSRVYELTAARNFYGVLRVEQRDSDDGPLRSLVHGRVTHGFQFLDEELRRVPMAYYGPASGLGLAERVLQEPGARRRLRTGVIGLGAGVLAAYGREGDELRFYEINPEVVRLAHEYFSYLHDTPARVDIVPGDARISLEQEQARGASQQYDLLVVDAFNGDAAPLHLLTSQAFALYDYHLRPNGLLAVNVTNQYLDMAPLIFGLADQAGMQAVLIEDFHRNEVRYETNRWVLVTRDATLLQAPAVAGHASPPPGPSARLRFSDDYSNLFQLLRRNRNPQ